MSDFSVSAGGNVEMQWAEYTVDGCIFHHDYVAHATAVNVQPAPDAYAHNRTVEVIPAYLMVDLDRDNRPRTIEILSDCLTVHDLLKVLRHCVWSDEPFGVSRD